MIKKGRVRDSTGRDIFTEGKLPYPKSLISKKFSDSVIKASQHLASMKYDDIKFQLAQTTNKREADYRQSIILIRKLIVHLYDMMIILEKALNEFDRNDKVKRMHKPRKYKMDNYSDDMIKRIIKDVKKNFKNIQHDEHA